MSDYSSNPYEGKWYASYDTMPGSPAILRVTGTLQMPTPGFTLTLKESVPQGINPVILLLDLIVTPPDPDMIVPMIITEEEVRFEKETGTQYESVTILPDGPDIPVENVS